MRQTLTIDAHEFVDQHETGIHAHSRHQLTFTRAGVLSIDIGSQRWVVPPRRAVWIPATVEHSIRAHGSTSARLAFVEESTEVAFPRIVTVVYASPLLREIIEELSRGDNDSSHHSAHDSRHHLEALFSIHLGRHSQLETPSTQPLVMSQLVEPRLAAIEHELRQNPADRRRLKEWGTFCGSSERSLSRLFANEAGTTFSHWRGQLRLQHAVIELAAGTSVTETAHQCGFASTSAFIDSFRSALGATPGRYFDD